MTVKTKAELLAIYDDAQPLDISRQNARDWIDTLFPSAVVTVAASDSTARQRATATFACDGTADEVDIQAAIDALDSFGGELLLYPGTYNLAATVVVDTNVPITI